MCKALTKCATVAQLNLKKKKSIDFYNIDIDMYTLWYIHKNYLQTHMPLYITVDNRFEAKNQLKRTTKAMSCMQNTMKIICLFSHV